MKKYSYPVILLAGGLGTRLREETEFRPKPMVPIGGRPILWHIMKMYAHYGFYRFIVCLGYKGEMIKKYFLNYHLQGVDFTINTQSGTITEHQINNEAWDVTLVDTGLDCMTGSRIAQVARYVDTDRFLVTYGDGLSDVNIEQLLQFHLSHKKLVTLTGINLSSRFGNLEIQGDRVSSFAEKKKIEDEWINGGFFVCERDFLRYVSTDKNCTLEQEPLKNAARDQQLMIHKHAGFWQCMDTYREHQLLENLWQTQAPWKVWQEQPKEFTPATRHTGIWNNKNNTTQTPSEEASL